MRKSLPVVLMFAFACSVVLAAETKKERRKAGRQSAAAPTLQMLMQTNEEDYSQQVASYRAEAERYKGIRVSIDEGLKVVSAPQLKLIATIMEDADFVPTQRLQRFSWIEEHQGTKISGWNATIVEAGPADGSMLVKFKVSPRHEGNAGLMTTDYTLETYMISLSGAQFLQVEFPTTPRIVTFN